MEEQLDLVLPISFETCANMEVTRLEIQFVYGRVTELSVTVADSCTFILKGRQMRSWLREWSHKELSSTGYDE